MKNSIESGRTGEKNTESDMIICCVLCMCWINMQYALLCSLYSSLLIREPTEKFMPNNENSRQIHFHTNLLPIK